MTESIHPARQRTLDDAGLGTAPLRTFKADARSHVWLVDAPAGQRVVKRFEYSRLRQRLGMVLGNHPALRELECNRRLRDAQIRVVPIVDAGVEGRGPGCRVWLATPLTGLSLHNLLDKAEGSTDERERLVDAAARLAADLIRAGFWFKDLKPSNIVIDGSGDAWLIDVGSARPTRKPSETRRMLKVMDRVLARGGADKTLRQRFAARVKQAAGKQEPASQPEAAEAP
jgi:tRNA A-37 threonylcarbamoyl transferase component Bud32